MIGNRLISILRDGRSVVEAIHQKSFPVLLSMWLTEFAIRIHVRFPNWRAARKPMSYAYGCCPRMASFLFGMHGSLAR
jgi:hypothetical protein